MAENEKGTCEQICDALISLFKLVWSLCAYLINLIFSTLDYIWYPIKEWGGKIKVCILKCCNFPS